MSRSESDQGETSMSEQPPAPPPPARGGPPVPQQPMTPAQATAQQSNGMAVASLVLGIVAVVSGIIPFLFVLGPVLGVLAIIFGFIGIGKANQTGVGKGMAIAGLVLGIVGTVLGILWIFAFSAWFGEAERIINDPSFTFDIPSPNP